MDHSTCGQPKITTDGPKVERQKHSRRSLTVNLKDSETQEAIDTTPESKVINSADPQERHGVASISERSQLSRILLT